MINEPVHAEIAPRRPLPTPRDAAALGPALRDLRRDHGVGDAQPGRVTRSLPHPEEVGMDTTSDDRGSAHNRCKGAGFMSERR